MLGKMHAAKSAHRPAGAHVTDKRKGGWNMIKPSTAKTVDCSHNYIVIFFFAEKNSIKIKLTRQCLTFTHMS